MLLTSVNEIDSRLGEGSKATIADVSIYRGKMGTGITDAYQLLMQIEGTPCLRVAVGEAFRTGGRRPHLHRYPDVGQGYGKARHQGGSQNV